MPQAHPHTQTVNPAQNETATSDLRKEMVALALEVQSQREKVGILQNNQTRGRDERIEWQRASSQQFSQITAIVTTLSNQVAALNATVESLRREIDRRPQ